MVNAKFPLGAAIWFRKSGYSLDHGGGNRAAAFYPDPRVTAAPLDLKSAENRESAALPSHPKHRHRLRKPDRQSDRRSMYFV
jgi:hypothetical protein